MRRKTASKSRKESASKNRAADLEEITKRVNESKYLFKMEIDRHNSALKVYGWTGGFWTGGFNSGVSNTQALEIFKEGYRTGPDQNPQPSQRQFKDKGCTVTCGQDNTTMIFSFKCTDKYDIFDRYYHFEKTLDTFLTDINEGYVEESDTSDNDSYSEMPLLEDPTEGSPTSTANSYLGMTSDQLRYYEEFFINKELGLAKKRELYESQRAHLQTELKQFINYPADTSNRSDCIEHASYIINTGNASDNDFGMTGMELENIDFIDEGDDYNDPESTEQPSDSDKRNSSNTELNFEYTQDVD